jgi:hypothetical protein
MHTLSLHFLHLVASHCRHLSVIRYQIEKILAVQLFSGTCAKVSFKLPQGKNPAVDVVMILFKKWTIFQSLKIGTLVHQLRQKDRELQSQGVPQYPLHHTRVDILLNKEEQSYLHREFLLLLFLLLRTTA